MDSQVAASYTCVDSWFWWPNGADSRVSTTLRQACPVYFPWLIGCYNNDWTLLKLALTGLGGQTVKNCVEIIFDQDEGARKTWPNGVASRSKFTTCVYLRVCLARTLDFFACYLSRYPPVLLLYEAFRIFHGIIPKVLTTSCGNMAGAGDIFDVCVIGAGVEGSSTARYLASRGKKTLLLEQVHVLYFIVFCRMPKRFSNSERINVNIVLFCILEGFYLQVNEKLRLKTLPVLTKGNQS